MKSKVNPKKKGEDEDSGLSEDSEKTDASFSGAGGDNTQSTQTEGKSAPLLEKLKANMAKKKSTGKKDKDDVTSTSIDVPEKKKTNVRVIILAMIVILGVVFWEEIFPPEDTEAPVVQTPAPRPKKNRKKIAETTESPADTEAVTPPAETTSEPVADTTAPGEKPESAPVDAPESTPTETTTADFSPKLDEIPEVEPEAPVEEPSESTTTESSTDTPPSSETGMSNTQDTIDGVSSTDSDENLTDKILQDLESQVIDKPVKKKTVKDYVPPPDYEYKGRGLVYNCSGKHWACVDAPSYKTCEDNNSSVKFLGKKIECYPFNIYATQKGCESIQNRMVSSSAKTQFCN